MPYLRIQSNHPIDPSLLPALSRRVAALLGKPEAYVMVALDPVVPMRFAGTDAPTAYLELKSIGLPRAQAPELSAALCALLEAEAGVPKSRIYIEFSSAEGPLWGWDGETF